MLVLGSVDPSGGISPPHPPHKKECLTWEWEQGRHLRFVPFTVAEAFKSVCGLDGVSCAVKDDLMT